MLRFRKKWIFLFLVLLAASVFLYIHFSQTTQNPFTTVPVINATPDPADYAATAFEKLEAAIAAEKNATTDFERFQLALKKRLITANYSEYINAHKNYDNARFERILQGNIC